MTARTIAQSIPTTVVPMRYAATFIDSTTPLDFDDRAELVAWVTDRTDGSTGPDGRMVRKAAALALVARAEAEGSAEGSTRGMAYVVEAWQHAALQGEADDLAAYLADIAPVGTPVLGGDAMNRNVEYAGRITEHTADVLRVAWTDGSTTEGAPLDMARMLTIDDDGTVVRAERAAAEAEADRIIARARVAAEAAPEAAPLVLSVPERVHRTDTFRATSTAGDMLSTHRFAFRTLSIAGRRAPVTAIVDPGWTAHDAADRALAYVVDTLGVTEAIALAAMLAAVAEAAQPWSNAGPVADLAGGVEVWCSAIRTQD